MRLIGDDRGRALVRAAASSAGRFSTLRWASPCCSGGRSGRRSSSPSPGTLGYLLAGTLLMPELWADPLGRLTKILPIMMLNLVCLAILDDR